MKSSDVVIFAPVHRMERYPAGASYKMLFSLKFREGWHSQSHTPSMPNLIPTKLTVAGNEGISPGRVFYPEGKLTKFAFSQEPLSTYEGTTYIGVNIAIDTSTKPGEHRLPVTLTLQACDEKACIMPANITLDLRVIVVAPDAPAVEINHDVFSMNEELFKAKDGEYIAGGDIKTYLTEHGLPLTYLFIFLGGLALNLTPCVYPLIPITVSYFGGESEQKRRRLFVHSVLYLLGMAMTYSMLGLFAAMTGSLFGGLLQHWAVIAVIAGAMAVLSLAMFGFYEIRPPAFLTQIGGKNRQGFFGTFMMGATVGIIAAPCIGPFVLGLLTFVGEKGDLFLGFTMFFTLAVGLGIPFVILALFSGAVSSLPRSGMWMVWVKHVFGFIMLVMAVYFLQPLLPDRLFGYILSGLLIISGAALVFIPKIKGAGKAFRSIRWAVSLAFVAAGAYLLYPSTAPAVAVKWEKASIAAIDGAKAQGKPVMIDFSAEWCVPCKELEHYTFPDPRVAAYSTDVVFMKADITKGDDAENESLKKRFRVIGVPTIIFLDKNGTELGDLRLAGFENAEDFLKRLDRAKQ
ncbi:MAG: thioredoxin family protein [Nitrospinae bacterium]|nr:thioredoxin family protein [Nitrospinota bacterium]